MTTLITKYDQGATGAVNRPINIKLSEIISVLDFGAVGDNSTDDTIALQNAFNAAKAAKKSLFIPAGTYKFTSTLIWDADITIYGEGSQSSILQKWGNITGITISNNTTYGGQQLQLHGISVISQAGQGDTTGIGINVLAIFRMNMKDVFSSNHGSHGFYFNQSAVVAGGEMGYFELVTASGNGGDGIRLNNINTSSWLGLDCISNTGIGFNIVNGDENFGLNVNCELNKAGGFVIDNSYGNIFGINIESCGRDCPSGSGDPTLLGGGSANNSIYGRFGNNATGLKDTGTTNAIIWSYWDRFISMPFYTRHTTSNNTVGRDINVTGGSSTAGTTATGGGYARINGGNAVAGAGTASGGRVVIGGGDGTTTAYDGAIQLGIKNDAASSEQIFCSAPFKFWPVSSTVRDNIANKETGMVIFNTTTVKAQIWTGAAWADLN